MTTATGGQPILAASRRAVAVKVFVVLLVAVIAIDTFPAAIQPATSIPYLYETKSAIRPFLRGTGLWQAEWRLFAPDPVISNCWWTIEASGEWADKLKQEPGQILAQSWNSPFLAEVSPWGKFYKRRHIAYFRRLSEFPRAVSEDFLDCWVRQRFGHQLRPLEDELGDSPTISEPSDTRPYVLELKLYRNELKLAFPDDGSLPSREETVWLSVTDKTLTRRYSL